MSEEEAAAKTVTHSTKHNIRKLLIPCVHEYLFSGDLSGISHESLGLDESSGSADASVNLSL